MIDLKLSIMRACKKNTLLFRMLRTINRHYVHRSGRFKSFFRRIRKPPYDIHALIHVDPLKITRYCHYSSNKFLDAGKILDGDWDRALWDFAQYHGIGPAYEAHFRQGIPWEKTEYFAYLLKKITAGYIHVGAKSPDELRRRFSRQDEIYDDIRRNGYRLQREIPNPDGGPLHEGDEVAVHVGRDGDLLLADGVHRLMMTRLLGLRSIPVRVSIRHAHWVRFVEEILDVARYNGDGHIYHQLTHPDLAAIPASHDDTRMRIIRQHLPNGEKLRVLDIGAHWGHFCHHLEALGHDCVAVESDPQHIYFLRKLRLAENRHFAVIGKSIFDLPPLGHFDVVLALNIFYHFLKTRSSFEKMTRFLSELEADHIFFQPHLTGELLPGESFKDFTPTAFVDFVAQTSGLRKQTLIGADTDQRPIYLLSK
ncbi:MAG: class I SAM-dependent methyltransferase [Elusimicrobiota bacterium]|jgi:hypothetical protein